MNLSLSTSRGKLDKAIPASRETLSLSGGCPPSDILMIRNLKIWSGALDDDFFWVIKRIVVRKTAFRSGPCTEKPVQYILDLENSGERPDRPGKGPHLAEPIG
jgi:hypothetical protein